MQKPKNIFINSVIVVLVLFARKISLQLCTSKVYCDGGILKTAQMSDIFGDETSYLKLCLTTNEDKVIESYESFMAEHPNASGYELQSVILDRYFDFCKDEYYDAADFNDFKENPSFLQQIKDVRLKKFAKTIVALWPKMMRKQNKIILEESARTSLLYVPNSYVVPGLDMDVYYYWDTYWIIVGLLLSEMYDTARGILENFVYLINSYGFIPYGGRVYYLGRAQPPLFTLMVAEYVTVTQNLTFLNATLEYMDAELSFWLENRTSTIKIGATSYVFARYNSESRVPRPERYKHDVKVCSMFTGSAVDDCYAGLNSASESGMEFSSRWFFGNHGSPHANISYVNASRLAPVDLNSYLAKSFQLLSQFYNIFKNERKSKFWHDMYIKWSDTIEKLMYHKPDGIWYDFDLKKRSRRHFFVATNFAPLWCELFNEQVAKKKGKAAYQYLKWTNADKFQGGVPTTLLNTLEVWDFPNALPPLQSIIILGLFRSGCSEAQEWAREKALAFINSVERCFDENGDIYNSFDAVVPGKFGGNIDLSRTGYGWTNGVILELLNTFGFASKASKCTNHIFYFLILLLFIIKT